MLPFVLPLIMAPAGAGLGALKDKKNRGRGALIGAGLGGLGGAGLGAMGIGAGGAGALGANASGVAAGLSGNVGPFANAAKYATALKTSNAMGGLKKMMPLVPLAMGAMGSGQQQNLPPMFNMEQPMPIAPAQSSQSYNRMPGQVQMSYNQPPVRGYYG